MDQNFTPVQSPSPHGTPLLRIVALLAFALLIAVLSSLGTYWYMSRQISQQTQQQAYQSAPTVEPTTSLLPTVTQDETANWKIFENDKFKIKYPPDWEVKITPLIGNMAPAFTPKGSDYPVLDVGYTTLQDFITPCKNLGLAETKITYNGLQATKCTGITSVVKDGRETNTIAQWRTVVIVGKDNKFSFNYRYASDKQNPYYENLLNTFLHSFEIK